MTLSNAPIAIPAFQDNYIWLIVDELDKTFLCIDPGDAAPVLAYAREKHLTLTHILLTHHHHDHVGGVSQLCLAYPNTVVYGPCDERLQALHSNVQHLRVIPLKNHTFHVLNTPGHTTSHICYYEPDQGWLFCGDTLFSAGCGRVFDGTMEELYQSIGLLGRLPDATYVFCGHEYTRDNLQFAASVDPENPDIRAHIAYLASHPNRCSLPSTIALEKKINPFVRNATSFTVFQQLRHDKDRYAAPK